MPKVFITQRDIGVLFARGQRTVELGEGEVLTWLAHEEATRLGMRLVQATGKMQFAPERPYLVEVKHAAPVAASASQNLPASGVCPDMLKARIHNAVMSRLGDQIDPALLDVIIERILSHLQVA